MNRPAGSLRLRLLAALLAVWALGLAAMTAQFLSQEATPEELLEKAGLATQARDTLAGLRFDAAGRFMGLTPGPAWRRVYAQPGAAYYTLIDPQARAVAVSPNLAAALPAIPLAVGEVFTAQRLIGPNQDLAAGARAPHGYELVVARGNPSRSDETPAERFTDMQPGLLFVAFALAGLAAVWGVAAWSLRPLARAAREAALIGPERPEARLTQEGLPSEIQPMAAAVNQALDRVAAAYANEKRFTAEAAHALRTPLAVLDLRLQRAEQSGHSDWAAVRADLAELSRVVSGLLTLSRADRGGAFRGVTEINLTRLAREAAAAFSPRLEAEGRRIEVEAPESPLLLNGDTGELKEMLYALVDNALIHGAGRVRIGLAADGPAIVLTVGDEGAGLADGEAMFERFHKGDSTSSGAGLGLAIVRQTARSHGGEARFAAPAVVEVRLAGLG